MARLVLIYAPVEKTVLELKEYPNSLVTFFFIAWSCSANKGADEVQRVAAGSTTDIKPIDVKLV